MQPPTRHHKSSQKTTPRSSSQQQLWLLGLTVILIIVAWNPAKDFLSTLKKTYTRDNFRRSMSASQRKHRNPIRRYVIAVSIDGLRAGVITQIGLHKLPHFARLIREGSSTLNARTDADFTLTLPNHTCMLTGRGTLGPQGHHYNRNRLPRESLHKKRGHYVASVFDSLHDHGYSTGLLASKRKFVLYSWSYNEDEGATDQHAPDHGRNKIDEVQIAGLDQDTMTKLLTLLQHPHTPHFLFVHLRGPDTKGHRFRWESRAYLQEIEQQDRYLGQILQTIESSAHLAKHTTLIVTTDHGGTLHSHRKATELLHYRIPFFVWGKDVQPGADLYQLNHQGYADPKDRHISYAATQQPIRNGNVANLVCQLFGLPPVAGSTIGSRYPLRLRNSSAPPASSPPNIPTPLKQSESRPTSEMHKTPAFPNPTGARRP